MARFNSLQNKSVPSKVLTMKSFESEAFWLNPNFLQKTSLLAWPSCVPGCPGHNSPGFTAGSCFPPISQGQALEFNADAGLPGVMWKEEKTGEPHRRHAAWNGLDLFPPPSTSRRVFCLEQAKPEKTVIILCSSYTKQRTVSTRSELN